jgi:hypothetical protein
VRECDECIGAGVREDHDEDGTAYGPEVCYRCDGAGVRLPRCAHGGCDEPARFRSSETMEPVCGNHRGANDQETHLRQSGATALEAFPPPVTPQEEAMR